MLQLDWSPEQVSAICTRLGYSVSHEWIYNYVRDDFNDGGSLFKHLRHKLKRYKRRFDKLHSITSDNGKEFAEHQRIARELDTDVYFADPYASYQRGANENANGLLRQYVPKGTDLRTVTHRQIEAYRASCTKDLEKSMDNLSL